MTLRLDDRALRILWPPRPATPNAPRPQNTPEPGVSAEFELGFQMPTQTCGPFTRGDLVYKFVYGGAAKLKARLLGDPQRTRNRLGFGAERQSNGAAQISAKYERTILTGVDAEISGQLSSNVVDEVSRRITAGDWEGAMQTIFQMKIKGGIPLVRSSLSNLDIEWDIGSDPDLCFFSAGLKWTVSLPLDGTGLNVPRGYTIELETTSKVRFGLSRQGWARIARRAGGPVIRAAARRIATAAARQAVGTALGRLGIYAIVIVGGTIAMLGLTHGLWTSAYGSGRRRGILASYCDGYLSRIQAGNTGSRLRSQGRRFQNGLRDAERAISVSGLSQVERTLIRHFGRGVGAHIDTRQEVVSMYLDMSDHLADEHEMLLGYLGQANLGSLGS